MCMWEEECAAEGVSDWGFSYEILLSCLSSSMQIYYYVWALGGERRSGPEIYFSGGMGIFPLFLLGFS